MPPRSQSDPARPARKPGTLVGVAEIAGQLGVSRQRVVTLSQRPDFPAPEVELRSGRVWRAQDIDQWIRRHRSGGTSANPP